MPLPFNPNPGTIVVCNYATGFRAPEMIKKRLAVTISPKLKKREGLVTVVPLSATMPLPQLDWHVPIDVEAPLPWGHVPRWAKCDMLATVGYDRLNLPHESNRFTGGRKYIQIVLSTETVALLRKAAAKAIGLG